MNVFYVLSPSGSGSVPSASTIALWVAVLGAILALTGNIVLDLWKRHHDRRAVAGAIAGEIEAYLDLLSVETFVPGLRNMAAQPETDLKRSLALFASLPDGHPVFDKSADKIGLLDPLDATDISKTYNIVMGMRSILTTLAATRHDDFQNQHRIDMLLFLTKTIEKQEPITRALITRLKVVAKERFSIVRSFRQIGWR